MQNSIYIGRQPIFDTRGEIFAYELLFRTKSTKAIEIDDDLIATVRVLINALNNIGTTSLLNGKKGFININNALLHSEIIELIPPKDFVLEILERCVIDEKMLERMRELKAKGYTFALDDFDGSEKMFSDFKPLFDIVSIIKIDVPFADDKAIEKLKKVYKQTLLAEKVESKEAYKKYIDFGFDLFQGYFFEKPSTISSANIDPSKTTVLHISAMLANDEAIERIIEAFQRDSKLTINLLRYINSAKFSFRNEIGSITQAISMVGYKGLHSWLRMYMYTELSDDPLTKALYEHVEFRNFIMRAFLKHLGKGAFAKKVSITAALSLVDAILNANLEDIISPLHIDQKVVDALLQHRGYLGYGLLLAKSLENSDLKKVALICKKVGISTTQPLRWQEQSYAYIAKQLSH